MLCLLHAHLLSENDLRWGAVFQPIILPTMSTNYPPVTCNVNKEHFPNQSLECKHLTLYSAGQETGQAEQTIIPSEY